VALETGVFVRVPKVVRPDNMAIRGVDSLWPLFIHLKERCLLSGIDNGLDVHDGVEVLICLMEGDHRPVVEVFSDEEMDLHREIHHGGSRVRHGGNYLRDVYGLWFLKLVALSGCCRMQR
jgi:hypothetical protein